LAHEIDRNGVFQVEKTNLLCEYSKLSFETFQNAESSQLKLENFSGTFPIKFKN
jgi:hypothetical protein